LKLIGRISCTCSKMDGNTLESCMAYICSSSIKENPSSYVIAIGEAKLIIKNCQWFLYLTTGSDRTERVLDIGYFLC
jgi:hypothetical protein